MQVGNGLCHGVVSLVSTNCVQTRCMISGLRDSLDVVRASDQNDSMNGLVRFNTQFRYVLWTLTCLCVACHRQPPQSPRSVEVVLPEDRGYVVEFTQEGMPGVMYLNKGLRDLQEKEVFGWHLSVMLQLEDLIDNGMPSAAERQIVDPYGELLASEFTGSEEKPNALFLARITWNGTRELIFRVHEPEPVHRYLQEHIAAGNPPREFDFRIDPDENWALTAWHFGTLDTE